MRRGLAAIALLALLTGVAALAQPADPRVSPLTPRSWALGNWPNLVKALQPGAPPQARSMAGSTGQSLAMAGREDLVVYDYPAIMARKVCKPLLRDGKPVDPVPYIVEAARHAGITMIGEGHAEPLTRDFIGKVAVALRGQGYAGYAAETFNVGIGGKSPAMPLASDGTYSNEPIYGRLIRRLRSLDYRLAPYEADFGIIDRKGNVGQQRRVMQAANLLAQMKRETSKLLVHAGEGNHSELVRANGLRSMGAIFAETSGIDPLTIDTISQEAPGEVPVVCDPAAFEGMPHSFDIRIGMPKLVFERGRPRWRLEAGDHFAAIPASLRRPDEIAVYEARPAGERGDSTPMDRLLLRPGETLPLLLPPGRYDLSVWTEKDGWSPIVPLSVAAD